MHKNNKYTNFSSVFVREDHESSILVFITQAQFSCFLRPACSSRELISVQVPCNTILGGVRDRSILQFQQERHNQYLRLRIIYLTRYMRDQPFPGPSDLPHLRYYYGPDYNGMDLEAWLDVLQGGMVSI